jgi:hypothetical protein
MNSNQSRQSIEQEIRVKSLKDPKFRQQLLENPKSAIEVAMGVNIPETLEIKVIEESANHLILTVPPALPESANSLSEEQLEAVAGGATPAVVGTMVTGAIAGNAVNEITKW